jgi:hypothetical protein
VIESYWETPENGDLFVVDGINPPQRWDGFASGFDVIGMDKPATAITLSGSGAGAIVGTYWAFERFIDSQDNVSDFSPISNTYTAQGLTGAISNITNATPLVVTSNAHGLPTGAWVKITGVGGITGANDTWQITRVDANNFSLDLSSGDGITPYTGGGTWISGVSTISYTSVPLPTESKVVRRQILRNTDGQATTFYVDVDTTNLIATSFTSTQTDTFLQSGISVPLLDTSGNIFANSNGKPPDYFAFLCQHLDRMFLSGNVEYDIGSVKVKLGSTTVTGVGTNWRATMANRFLYVVGASGVYQIASVNMALQTLTLMSPWTDQSSNFSFYAIKPAPGNRRLVAYSGPGTPQSWLVTNALELQETGDEISGLLQKDAFLYILEQRHIHKLTFSTDPAVDGAVFMAARRGSINNRCWVVVDQHMYMLDELGVHRFVGNSEVEQLSSAIQDVFRTDGEGDFYNVNWTWKENFHAVLDRQRDTIRWFVCLDGNRYPRHALTLNYRQTRWGIEEYPVPIGGACDGYVLGLPQVFYGAQHGKVVASWQNTLDLASSARGTVQGIVGHSALFSLTDPLASFDATIVNTSLTIVAGTGKGQTRRIVAISGSTLSTDSPWLTLPDATSVYQIGGVRFLYLSQWLRFTPSDPPDDSMKNDRFELIFEPMTNPVTADLQFFLDYTGNAEPSAQTVSLDDGGGIGSIAGDPRYVVDLTRQTGLVQKARPMGKEYFISGRRYIQFSLEGYSNDEQVCFFQWSFEGAIVPGQQ